MARSSSNKCLRTLTGRIIIIYLIVDGHNMVERSRKIVSLLGNQINKSIACPPLCIII